MKAFAKGNGGNTGHKANLVEEKSRLF